MNIGRDNHSATIDDRSSLSLGPVGLLYLCDLFAALLLCPLRAAARIKRNESSGAAACRSSSPVGRRFCSLGKKIHLSVPVATPLIADPTIADHQAPEHQTVFVALSTLGISQPFKPAVRSRQDRALAGACDKSKNYTSDEIMM